MLERFRSGFSDLLTPVARRLLAAGVSPDAVTWAGTAVAVLVAVVCFPQGWLVPGALLLGLTVLTDSVDGVMARLSDRTSPWGAFLDATLDRVADGAVFAAVALWFAWGGSSPVGLVAALVALVAGQVTSYAKARASAEGLRADGGIAARADRLVIVLLGALLAGLGLPLALELAVAAVAVMGVITVGQRIVRARAGVSG